MKNDTIQKIVDFMPNLRTFAKSISFTDSEDLVQTTVERAILRLDSFDGANLQAWLFTILKNTAFDEFRRQKYVRDNQELYFESISTISNDNPEAALIAKQIINKLSVLTETQQEAILAIAVHNLKYQEVAEYQGVSEGTVKSRLSRGREKLRQLVK